MPFKSEAQRKKFLELLSKGEISQETFDEWDRATDRKKLLPRAEKKLGKPKRTKIHNARVIK